VEDNIEIYIKKIEKVGVNWIYMNQDACSCWARLTEEILAPPESSFSSSRRFCLHAV